MAAQQGGHRRPFLARRIAAEPAYRRRVEAAERLGIPGTQLDGREPATETRHFYDRRGRLIRSVTTSEPRWTEMDRAEVLALSAYRDGLCPLCGRPVEVCTSEEESGPAFGVQQSTCRATLAIIEKQRALTDGGKKASPYAPAFLWAAITRE